MRSLSWSLPLVLLLSSLTAALPVEGEEGQQQTLLDQEEAELYDDETGPEEGEEVEYGFHPLDEPPEAHDVPDREKDTVKPEKGVPPHACAPDLVEVCVCSDGGQPPCEGGLPGCTCTDKPQQEAEDSRPPSNPAVDQDLTSESDDTASTSITTSSTTTATTTTESALESSTPTTPSNPEDSELAASESPVAEGRPPADVSSVPISPSTLQDSTEAPSAFPAGLPPPPPPPASGFRRPGGHLPLRPFAGQRRPFPPSPEGSLPHSDSGHQDQSDEHHEHEPSGVGERPSGPFAKPTPGGQQADRTTNRPLPPTTAEEEPVEPLLPGQPTSFCEDGTLARCERRCANGAPLPCAPGNEPACFCRDGSTPARATSVLSQRLRPTAAGPQRSDQPVSLGERFAPSRPAEGGDFVGRKPTLY